MGIRDIIAHHYFDLDAEIVYNVVKSNLPEMLMVVKEHKNHEGTPPKTPP